MKGKLVLADRVEVTGVHLFWNAFGEGRFFDLRKNQTRRQEELVRFLEISEDSARALVSIFWVLLDHLVEDGAEDRRDLEGLRDCGEVIDERDFDGDVSVHDR